MMRHLNFHVVGGAKNEVADQVIVLEKKEKGAAAGAMESKTAVIIAAVPYLRDRDLRYSIAGESPEDRKDRMRAAILSHYQQIATAVAEKRTDKSTPVLATGHLFAAGSEDAEDKKTHIYLADKNNIEAGQFPEIFDYVALGHIHQAQRVGGREAVRYSGSLVPLTFGEARQPQSVCLFDLKEAGAAMEVKKVTVPRFRELVSIRGTAEEVLEQLAAQKRKEQTLGATELATWVEVRVTSPHPLPLLKEELAAVLEASEGDNPDIQLPEILRSSIVRPEGVSTAAVSTLTDLNELDPEEVFYQLCHGDSEEKREDYPELLDSFRELRQWMDEEKTEA
jgi:exonuclease SbcD